MLAIAETNRQLSASLARQNLPKCHPDVFSGDFAMFHAWKKAFQAMIYDAEISPEQEINYLHKYTSGEPQKLIDNYRKRIDDNQFKVIKELWSEMERRFGDAAAITNALLQRLEDASRFGEKDAKKLQEFSTNYDLYPDFEVFAREVRKYARLKNHPNVTVYENVRTDIPRSERKDRYKDEDHRILKGNTESPSPSSEEKHCQFHDRQGHDILECKAFARKTLQQRSDWTKKSGLCFRCFAKGHNCKKL
jgi:hypothetical protein